MRRRATSTRREVDEAEPEGWAHCCTEHATDAWAPVELTWSVIRPGDIILAARTRLPWIVTTVTGTEVTAVCAARPPTGSPPTRTPRWTCCARWPNATRSWQHETVSAHRSWTAQDLNEVEIPQVDSVRTC